MALIIIVIVGVMMMGGGGGGSFGIGEVKTANWQPYTSSEGKYSIELPLPAQTNTEQYGGTSTMHHYASANMGKGGGTYTVVHYTANSTLMKLSPQLVLSNALDTLIMKFNAMSANQHSININGHPGYAFDTVARVDSVEKQIKGRVFLVQNRIYRIYWVGPKSRVPDNDINRMFNSFKLRRTHPAGAEKKETPQR